ncbi:uncharacterized protein EAE97_000026 [Botrytis byssoidea]|uniref:DUF7587 domain-containing protein n=1 Tax=Botrytis byssoidea TaxID=139641 RepID=A0A9P5IUK9_9HELO|nr:uncharacterized protein EAE97_000026 [Botrytis byssoidea]KAF7954767.1 hypothetical protein EAE97_000026 [Botrytis byssoidea]
MTTESEIDFATLFANSATINYDNSNKVAAKPPQTSSADGFVSSNGFQPPTPLSNENSTSTETPTRPQSSAFSSPLFESSLNNASEPNLFRSDLGASFTSTHTSSNNGSSSRPAFSFAPNPATPSGSLFGNTSVHSPTTPNAKSRPLFGFASSSNNPSFGNKSYVPSTSTSRLKKRVQTSTQVPAFDFLSTAANNSTTLSVPPAEPSQESSFNNLRSSTDKGTSTPHAPRTSHIKIDSPKPAPSSPPTPITTTSSENLILTLNHDSNLKSEDLRPQYQTLQFYRKWTSHLISHLTGIPIIRTTPPLSHRPDHPNELIPTHHLNQLPENELATAKSELEALVKHLLTLSLPCTPQIRNTSTDILLYRLHTATSKSTYSRSYGFRCSGWTDSLYASGVTSERQKNGQAFQAHCNATSNPSPYISVSTSIARLMKLPAWKKEEEADIRIFVISLNRLGQLGIKAQSTELYFNEFVNSPGGKISKKNGDKNHLYVDGVSFVTDTHWVVEEWIPDQAIVSEMNCEEFFNIADREGISWEDARNYSLKAFKAELEPRKIDLEKWPKRYPGGRN